MALAAFVDWTAEQWKKALAAVTALLEEYDERLDFYEGRHWREGEGWIGPRPYDATEDGFSETMDVLEGGFVSSNVVLEGTERHVGGVLGYEPAWRLAPRRALAEDEKPTPTEQALITEGEAALTVWWDQRGVPLVMRLLAATLLLAGRASMRLYVPASRLSEIEAQADEGEEAEAPEREADEDAPAGFTLSVDTLEQALDAIFVEHPLPTQAALVEDAETKEVAGIYLLPRREDEPQGEERFEVTYLDVPEARAAEGEAVPDAAVPTTVIVQITGGTRGQEHTFDLGGRLPLYEGQRPALVTPQVLALQKAHNLALSMLPRNVVTGGFMERTLLDAQMPGEWIRNDRGERIKFVPDEYHAGAGTTNFVQGSEVQHEDGTTEVRTPSINFRPPVPVTPTVEGEMATYQKLLHEMRQAHILTNSQTAMSGISREQARDDYVDSLRLTQGAIESVGRWLLETALAMAEDFTGQAGRFTSLLRVEFACRINAGPLTAEEQKAVIEQMKEGVLSRETAMARLGVADVAAEMAVINRQADARLALMTKQLEALAAAYSAGLDLALVAEMLGMEDKFVAALKANPPTDPSSDEEFAQ
jgi:hypothetical protein